MLQAGTRLSTSMTEDWRKMVDHIQLQRLPADDVKAVVKELQCNNLRYGEATVGYSILVSEKDR